MEIQQDYQILTEQLPISLRIVRGDNMITLREKVKVPTLTQRIGYRIDQLLQLPEELTGESDFFVPTHEFSFVATKRSRSGVRPDWEIVGCIHEKADDDIVLNRQGYVTCSLNTKWGPLELRYQTGDCSFPLISATIRSMSYDPYQLKETCIPTNLDLDRTLAILRDGPTLQEIIDLDFFPLIDTQDARLRPILGSTL